MKINDFLKKIASEMKNNHYNFEKIDFYYMLKYVGVKKDTSLVLDIEAFYQEFLESLSDSLVKYETKKVKKGENTTHYIGFYADKKANYLNAVKVYIPVKYEYLEACLKKTMVYLIRNNILSVVKFHEKATNEGIVIRFYKKEDVMPFIEYLKKEFALEDLLIDVNPFIACIDKIGIVKDNNTSSSYNETLSDLLEKYFKKIELTGLYEKVSELDFLNYIITLEDKEESEATLFNMKAIENNIKAIILNTNPLD